GPAQHVSQKAPGDDFKSDLLSSLMGLGPGAVGALLDNPADQNWNPADHARQRTAGHSRTAVNQSGTPAPRRLPTTVRGRASSSALWTWLGLGGGLLFIGAMVLIYLRTEPPKTETVAAGNTAEQAKKTEPEAKTDIKTPPEAKTE